MVGFFPMSTQHWNPISSDLATELYEIKFHFVEM